MDELLELMNDDSVDDSTLIVDRDEDDDSSTDGDSRRMKTAFASAENRNNKGRVNRGTREASRATAPKRSDPTFTSSSNQDGPENLAKASVDDRLDIRMTNRLVSSNDLMELITDYDYKSPSVLSAMTLKHLNALLQEPSRIIDPVTVAGKTESLVTVGIVFSNTGTRISSKGGAFCVLTIGNLNSGPCLTIFLFGGAYGKYCTSCKQGKVIALMAPKLLPADRGDAGGSRKGPDAARTVSFSVYDAGQLKIVANARDYGICKEQGCKNHVDKRVSECCDFHRRKSKGANQAQNKFQQVQGAHRQASAILVDSTARKRNLLGSGSSMKSNRFLNKSLASNTHSVHTAKPTKAANASTSTSSNRYLSTNIPKNMSKVLDQKLNKRQTFPSGVGSISTSRFLNANVGKNMSKLPERNQKSTTFVPSERKPLAKRVVASVSGKGIGTSDAKRPKKSLVNGDWLEQGKAMSKERGPTNTTSGRKGFSLSHFTKSKQRSATLNPKTEPSANNNKTRSINTGGKGFDGSVMIPKASSLFNTPNASTEVATRIVTPKNDPKVREGVLQKQAELARQIKEGGHRNREEKVGNPLLSKSRVRASHTKKSGKGPSRERSTEVNDFLAAMGGEVDEEKVRNAKSKFANEVEADEYAKQRLKVDELEKAEASHEMRNKKKKETKRITRTWFCKACGNAYFKNPTACRRAGHEVEQRIDIKDNVTKEQRRNELNKKNVEDGGLRVGSGLDWSSFGNR